MYKLIRCNAYMDANKTVNSIAKSINKRLDGSYFFKREPNACEIKSTILYQIPKDVSDRYNLDYKTRSDVKVMDVWILFTSYSNKIRVEINEIKPEETTIGFKLFPLSTFNNMTNGISKVMDFIQKSIEKEFQGYEILF